MIAAWMVEIKYWFELSGPGSFWALVVCALFILPLCLVYSEMTSMLPFAGGENVLDLKCLQLGYRILLRLGLDTVVRNGHADSLIRNRYHVRIHISP